MESNRKREQQRTKGLSKHLEKCAEWYNVYETRLAINLLEPWEKCLANLLIIIFLALIVYLSLSVFKLVTGIVTS